MNTIPSLQDWLKENPDKGINDYYQLYGRKAGTIDSSPSQKIVYSGDQQRLGHRKQGVDWKMISIIMGILGLLTFFLPWLRVDLLGMINIGVISGNNLPKVVNQLFILSGVEAGAALKFWKFSPYLIPITALLSLISSSSNAISIRIIFNFLFVIISSIWLFLLNRISNQIKFSEYYSEASLQIGYYFLVIVAVYFLFDILRGLSTGFED